jgi:serine/threonine protein kinase
MQHVNGIPVYDSDPNRLYEGLRNYKPTWYSAQGGVYRCRQKMSPKALIAIKKYHVEESQDDPHAFIMPRDLVENEIYAMTRCEPHPNILKLLSVHLHQECIYLIMPLCTGGSMQEYVFENRITVGQLVYILRAVCTVCFHHCYVTLQCY